MQLLSAIQLNPVWIGKRSIRASNLNQIHQIVKINLPYLLSFQILDARLEAECSSP